MERLTKLTKIQGFDKNASGHFDSKKWAPSLHVCYRKLKFSWDRYGAISGSDWGWHSPCELPRTSRLCALYPFHWARVFKNLKIHCLLNIEIQATLQLKQSLHNIWSHCANWNKYSKMSSFIHTTILITELYLIKYNPISNVARKKLDYQIDHLLCNWMKRCRNNINFARKDELVTYTWCCNLFAGLKLQH